MPRRQRSDAAECQGRQIRRQQVEGPSRKVQGVLPLGNAIELVDRRLVYPANRVPWAQRVLTMQQRLGNTAVRAVLVEAPGRVRPVPLIQQRVAAGAVARDLAEPTTEAAIAEAGRQAGAPSGPWPALAAAQRQEIRGLIQAHQEPQALQRMWQVLRPGLPLGGRVTVELTAQLGTVGGQLVSPSSSASAIALPYVARGPECAGVAPEQHWQRHTGAEVRAIVQVNPSVLDGDPDECVSRLHSTLMHEYTHVEQQVSRGFFEGLTFVVVGEREFLSEQAIPQAQRGLLAALDEIGATCAEIENAQRTGLAASYDIRTTVCYLWDQYEDYFSAVGGNPDRGIAARVHGSIQAGRQMLQAYLESPAGAWIPAQSRAVVLQGCPLGYDASKIEPFVGP